MPQQLELDLWQILAVAQTEPAAASMVILCRHLEGLDLIDGARAILELGEIYRSRAEVVLAEIATAYLPEQEPIRSLMMNCGSIFVSELLCCGTSICIWSRSMITLNLGSR